MGESFLAAFYAAQQQLMLQFSAAAAAYQTNPSVQVGFQPPNLSAMTSAAATSPSATLPAATSPAATSPAATSPAATSPAATSPAATSPAATSPPSEVGSAGNQLNADTSAATSSAALAGTSGVHKSNIRDPVPSPRCYVNPKHRKSGDHVPLPWEVSPNVDSSKASGGTSNTPFRLHKRVERCHDLCGVCFESQKQIYMLDTCRHLPFCKQCLSRSQSKKCPTCNTPYLVKDMMKIVKV